MSVYLELDNGVCLWRVNLTYMKLIINSSSVLYDLRYTCMHTTLEDTAIRVKGRGALGGIISSVYLELDNSCVLVVN